MFDNFFNKKWAEGFRRHFSGVKAMLSTSFVTDDRFESFHMETYNYIFATALLAKVKTKDLVKLMEKDGKKLTAYVEEVLKELKKMEVQKAKNTAKNKK
jgi:hypothetical protein